MTEEELLLSEEEYQKSGIHIGTQVKSKDMQEYIFKIRNDGLYILDIKKTNSKLIVAGKMLSRFKPSEILVVAQRQYAFKPVTKFSEVVGAESIVGRFIPGTLTNQLQGSKGNHNHRSPGRHAGHEGGKEGWSANSGSLRCKQ